MIIFSELIADNDVDNSLISSSELEVLKNSSIKINYITNNTKEISDDSIFFAINSKSLQYFVNDFKDQNLFCIICDFELKSDPLLNAIYAKFNKIIFSQHINIRKLYCNVVANFYKLNQFPLKICAITGTNGKSSTAFFYKQLCNDHSIDSLWSLSATSSHLLCKVNSIETAGYVKHCHLFVAAKNPQE